MEYMDNIFWGLVGFTFWHLLVAFIVTGVADNRHPDRWTKEKVADDSVRCGWRLVDVPHADHTEGEDWVIVFKVVCWTLAALAVCAGMLHLGAYLG